MWFPHDLSKIMVYLPALRQPVAGTVDEVALPQPTESLVARDGRVGIEPGQELAKVGRSVGVARAPEPELAEADPRAAELLRVAVHEVGHVVGEVGFHGGHGLVDGQFVAVDVVVHVDDVEAAVLAVVHEILQPAETGGTAAVGDGGRGKGGSALEGLEELPPDRGSLVWSEVCLAGVVRFVRAVES